MKEALTTKPKQEIVQALKGVFYCLVIAYVLYLAYSYQFTDQFVGRLYLSS